MSGIADVTLSWYNPGSQDAGSEVGTWALGWRGAPLGGSSGLWAQLPVWTTTETLGLGGPRVQGERLTSCGSPAGTEGVFPQLALLGLGHGVRFAR